MYKYPPLHSGWPNGEALRKCILSGPYKPTTMLVHTVEATDDSPAVPEHTTPEWSRFVTIVKQQHKLDEVSYHKLFDILKQYQNEVNELHAEKLAGNANPLALRTVNVAGTREKVGSQVVQKTGIQCFNCKEYGCFAKECRKPKGLRTPCTTRRRCCCVSKLSKVQNDTRYNVFANALQHSEQSESVSNTCLVETDDSNVTPDSPDMCDDDIQNDQNDAESDDERVALANLIANLKLDVDENKKIQKQLKKENTTLAQELKECKTILAETSKSLRESISIRDSFLVALQPKQTEFEKYKAFNDRTIDYDKFEHKLNEALCQLAQKGTVIREGLVKQKTKVITDLKLREEHDIEKMLSMEKQLTFLNEVVYKRSQSIQTIHMMAPNVSTYNGRPTFANPRYLKQAQSEIPYLYAFPYDQNTHANRLILDGGSDSST
nr:hypothetical protein [Tanacetum cinerariifolium]